MAAIGDGPIFRWVNRLGKVWGEGITPKAIWHIVKAAALKAGIYYLISGGHMLPGQESRRAVDGMGGRVRRVQYR